MKAFIEMPLKNGLYLQPFQAATTATRSRHDNLLPAFVIGKFNQLPAGLLDQTHFRNLVWISFNRKADDLMAEIEDMVAMLTNQGTERFHEFREMLPRLACKATQHNGPADLIHRTVCGNCHDSAFCVLLPHITNDLFHYGFVSS